MAFQRAVSAYLPVGIEGGWSGDNPIYTLTNPDEAQWVVGATGAIVGRFGWGNWANGRITSAHPGVSTVRVGFIHRDQPVYISGLLLSASNQLTVGQGIDALADGPVWAKFAAGATVDQYVYASFADGSCRAAATGSPATATGVTVTTTNGSPNLTAVTGGTLYPGQPISGTGVPANTYVVSVGVGTAVMSNNATASGTTIAITQTLDQETPWRVRSNCAAGEIAKISVRG